MSPLLLGHRGARASKSIPENTLASFDQALADGCDGFEFDLRLTADGEAVVCHDPESGRVQIAHARAEQLPTLPRLRNVLARYSDAFLDIELKVPGLEKIVIDALAGRSRDRFVVSSFLPAVLRDLHRGDATIPLGLICETRAQLHFWNELTIEYLIPHHALLQQDLAKEAQARGNKILVWTVNTASGMKRFAKWGVAGIISDDTRLLRKTLG